MRPIFLLVSVLLGLAGLLTGPVGADEARPVYVEIVEQKSTEYLLKWKIPPVMPGGQEPAVELNHSSCSLVGGGISGQPAGLVG
ncbi:hypothetical protein N9Q86_02180, partial [Porticoccaceae bacterium]|nr:hypothetical protein [Porticoccaceae bacterium]